MSDVQGVSSTPATTSIRPPAPNAEHDRNIRAQVLTAFIENAMKGRTSKLVLTEADIRRLDIAWDATLGRA